MAEELGQIYKLIENKLALLPLLENLCSTDETVVREQAVKSLAKISSVLPNSDIQNFFAPMLIRLSAIVILPSRLSSIGLFNCCYKCAGSQKENSRK